MTARAIAPSNLSQLLGNLYYGHGLLFGSNDVEGSGHQSYLVLWDESPELPSQIASHVWCRMARGVLFIEWLSG
jgi:hypothetical protein